MLTVYRFRIKDSNAAKQLDRMARAVNFVWNFCNQTQLHAVKWNMKWPTGYDLNKLTAGVSKELGIQSQTVNAICEEYATRRLYACKTKLRWRSKRSLGWIPFKASGIRRKGNVFTYYGVRLPVWDTWSIDMNLVHVKCGSLAEDARGRWYLNLTCEMPDLKPSKATSAIGVDLGLKTLATASDGTQIASKRFYRDLEADLAGAQRANKKGRAKTIHAKIANRRKDFLHK
ncbi:MAG: RNA-guided endonuclease InsQ/TnpB family protein, partial [Gammaproteobacteria bacterium]